MAKFQKGHKLAKGGLRNPPGGRPTKEEQVKKLSFLEALQNEREKRAAKLAIRYFEMAEEDPATMRHAVDRVEPAARQQIDITGGLKIIRVDAFKPE